MNEYHEDPDLPFAASEIIIFILQFIFVLPVTIAIFSLFIYQFSCMYEGQTSIEVMHCNRYTKYLKHRGYKFNWFYKFGPMENIKQVLGSNVLNWFIPNIPNTILKGNGMSFKTRVYPPLPPYEYKREKETESSGVEGETKQ